MAIMNASTQWHWGQGDHDADFEDDEADEATLALTHEGPGNQLALTWNPESGEKPPTPSPPASR